MRVLTHDANRGKLDVQASTCSGSKAGLCKPARICVRMPRGALGRGTRPAPHPRRFGRSCAKSTSGVYHKSARIFVMWITPMSQICEWRASCFAQACARLSPYRLPGRALHDGPRDGESYLRNAMTLQIPYTNTIALVGCGWYVSGVGQRGA